MSSKLGNSRASEQERPHLENLLFSMNLNMMKERYQCSDIFPKVTVDLVRAQDRKNEERINLAHAISETMTTRLDETFSGSKDDSKLVLRVNISVVSDGCARNARIAKLFNRGSAQGKGLAKLAVSYFLYNRKSGKMAVAKQLSRCQGPDCDNSCIKEVLMELEEELLDAIRKDVTCCIQLSQRKLVSIPLVELAKLNANQEDTTESSSGSTW